MPKTLEKYMNAEGAQPDSDALPPAGPRRQAHEGLDGHEALAVIGPEKANGTGDNSGGAGVPTAPDGDCDSDGVKNGADPDDDNDLLGDALELPLLLDPCVGDTDGDGVEDGFEYQSAIDLNNDDYQTPNYSLPYPGKTAVPEPAVQGRRQRLRRRRPGRSARSTSSGSTRTRSTTPRRAR